MLRDFKSPKLSFSFLNGNFSLFQLSEEIIQKIDLWKTELGELTAKHDTLVKKKVETEIAFQIQKKIAETEAKLDYYAQAAENAVRDVVATEAECKSKRENYKKVKNEL